MRRVQIRETILSHFEKEEQNFNMGIKTLSLFFIDEVAKYRQYDENGNEVLGEYGRVFEEEYYSVLADYRKFLNPAYLAYLDGISAESTHKGYFSIDKKTGRAIDSTLKRGSEFSDDISAYDLILKNKERLLSFEEPTRFHLLPFRAARGLGQSQRIPNLHTQARRRQHHAEAAGGWAWAAPVRQSAGRSHGCGCLRGCCAGH